jgi:hypothetical protein
MTLVVPRRSSWSGVLLVQIGCQPYLGYHGGVG